MSNGKVKFPRQVPALTKEVLGGTPLTFAFGRDLVQPWRGEGDKAEQLMKLIYFLQYMFEKQNLNLMNVECLGGWDRFDWIQRIQHHAVDLFVGCADPATDGGDCWVFRRGVDSEGFPTLEVDCLDDEGNHDADKSISLLNTVFNQNGDIEDKFQLEVDADTVLGDENTNHLWNTIFADASGGNIVIELPEKSTVLKHHYRIIKVDDSTNTVEIKATGVETFLGSTDSFFLVRQGEDQGVEATESHGWF